MEEVSKKSNFVKLEVGKSYITNNNKLVTISHKVSPTENQHGLHPIEIYATTTGQMFFEGGSEYIYSTTVVATDIDRIVAEYVYSSVSRKDSAPKENDEDLFLYVTKIKEIAKARGLTATISFN